MVHVIIKSLYALVFIFVVLPIYWIVDKVQKIKEPVVRDMLMILIMPIGILNDFVISPKVEGQLGHDHKLEHDPNFDINQKLH